MRLTIRTRITLIFAVMMAVVLSAAGAFLFLRFRADLMQAVDAGLRSRGQTIVGELNRLSPLTGGILIETDEAFAQVLDADGSVIDSSPDLDVEPVLPPSSVVGLREPRFFTSTVRTANDRLPARLLAVPLDAGTVVVVGASLEDRREALDRLATILAVGGPVTLLLATGVGWVVAGVALGPVERMRSQAAAISADDLGRRLPVPETRDELARLADTLNAMLDRLRDALDRERRFVTDASHELRTPLANLKAELELSLVRSRTETEMVGALRSASAETDRLVRLAEDLLVLARAEQGQLSIAREPVDVGALTAREVGAFTPLAARHGTTIGSRVSVEGAVSLDPTRYRQIVGNLLDNAIRHSPADAQVTVDVWIDDGSLMIEVGDRGEGFPPEFLPHAFDAFARAEASRPREVHDSGGTGLGLTIVQALSHALGGTAHARNRPEGGAEVIVTLPLS